MTTLDPRAIQISQSFYATRPNFALHVQDHLIELLNRNGLKVYSSTALDAPVIGQYYCREGERRVVIPKNQPLIRKRFVLAKALARVLLGDKWEALSNVQISDCQTDGAQRLENHLACALLVPQAQVRGAYLRYRTLEQFAEHFQVSVLCAKLCLATYEGPKAVTLMRLDSALQQYPRTRKTRSGAYTDKDQDWTSELVSAGVGAALSAAASALLGF